MRVLKKNWLFNIELASTIVAGLFVIAMWFVIQIAGVSGTVDRAFSSTDTEPNIVYAEGETIKAADKNDQLQTLLTSIKESYGNDIAVYIEDIDFNYQAGLNENQVMKAASLYKLFVANEAFKMIDDGDASLEQTVDSQRNLSLRKCLQKMITVSDNDCGVALQSFIGATHNELPQLKAQGYGNTSISGVYPKTTANDVAELFKSLLNKSYLSKSNNDLFLNYLSDQEIIRRLPQGLPRGVYMSHKTGDLEGYTHDAGIVYGPDSTYILVVMSGPWQEPDTSNEIFWDISADVFDVLNPGRRAEIQNSEPERFDPYAGY